MTADNLVADIQSARSGDADAWQRLLETYRPAMESWSAGIATDNELSQSDLVQTAWLRVFKGLHSFKGADQPDHIVPMFYQWLKVTARNAMLTRIKHGKARCRSPKTPLVNGHEDLLADIEQKTPSSIAVHNEQLNRLASAVERLADPLDRQIVSMVTEDGLSLRIVATTLDRDYSTIRRRFNKFLERLERALE